MYASFSYTKTISGLRMSSSIISSQLANFKNKIKQWKMKLNYTNSVQCGLVGISKKNRKYSKPIK